MGRFAPSFAYMIYHGMQIMERTICTLRSLRSLPMPLAQGANGESEGKAPQGPVPLRAAQRNQIYGKGAPEGPRFHMNDEAA